MTHVCPFFSQTHHKHAAWSCFSPTLLLGSGHEPPLEFTEEKYTCWFAREIIVQKHPYLCFLMHFALILNILVFQPVLCFYTSPETFDKHKMILWAPIYALPGHICIYYTAKLQTISLTKTIANCRRAQKKPLILIFSPCGWIPGKMNPFSQAGGHQGDFMRLSGLHWEMCRQGHICFSLRPTVEAGQHDPNRSLYHNKCPWIPCLWSTAYRVGYPRSISDR